MFNVPSGPAVETHRRDRRRARGDRLAGKRRRIAWTSHRCRTGYPEEKMGRRRPGLGGFLIADGLGLTGLGGAFCGRANLPARVNCLTVLCRFGSFLDNSDCLSARRILRRSLVRWRSPLLIKSELVQRIGGAQPAHSTSATSRILSTPFLMRSTAALARGSGWNCADLALFRPNSGSARTGAQPTYPGDQVPVIEKVVPFFKTGKELRERLNKSVIG